MCEYFVHEDGFGCIEMKQYIRRHDSPENEGIIG